MRNTKAVSAVAVQFLFQVVNLLLQCRQVLSHYSSATIVSFLGGGRFSILLLQKAELIRFRCVWVCAGINVGHTPRICERTTEQALMSTTCSISTRWGEANWYGLVSTRPALAAKAVEVSHAKPSVLRYLGSVDAEHTTAFTWARISAFWCSVHRSILLPLDARRSRRYRWREGSSPSILAGVATVDCRVSANRQSRLNRQSIRHLAYFFASR